MPTTDELWLKMAYWQANNPDMTRERMIELLMERYPKMTKGEAWTAVVRYRNEKHTLAEHGTL